MAWPRRSEASWSPALRVVGRTSSAAFRGRDDDLRAIGRALDVVYPLEGSVRREGSRLRVTAQLVRAEDGSHLWSKTYARELRDIFAVQDGIARDVALALRVKLDVARFNREQGGTTRVDAYERFLRWRDIVMREQFEVDHDRERLRLRARDGRAGSGMRAVPGPRRRRRSPRWRRELDGPQADRLRAEAAQVRAHIARIAPGQLGRPGRDRSNALWREGRHADAIALAKQVADGGPPTKERSLGLCLHALRRRDTWRTPSPWWNG